MSPMTKREVQKITSLFSQFVYPGLPEMTLPTQPEEQRLTLKPVMYFSGYIALMPPPPFYNELPLGYTTMFRLESQFPFISFEVELSVTS